MKGLEVLRLRLRLWWNAKPFWYHYPYRVTVRKNRAIGPYGRQWWYVNRLAKETIGVGGSIITLSADTVPIGPIRQWTPEEAELIAREQHETRLNIARRDGSGHAETGEASSFDPAAAHQLVYALLPDNNYRIGCAGCDWVSSPTQPGHMCRPENCAACADVHREFEEHAALELASPSPSPTVVDRQTGDPHAR